MIVAALIETTFREEHGRVLAGLISQFGDFALAEDALQDALVEALTRWPTSGVPRNPGAWLTTVARRRAIYRLRRAATLERTSVILNTLAADDEEETEMESIPDDRLKLMFTCCHPSLALEAQVALTLHTLGGLSTPEIARAFLVPAPTMAQRLARARAKDPQRGNSLPRAAGRSATGAAGRAAGGHLPDLQRGLLRHQRRYAQPARTV